MIHGRVTATISKFSPQIFETYFGLYGRLTARENYTIGSSVFLKLQLMSQSIPTGYSPRATPGDSLKKLPGGRDLTFESCVGPGIGQGQGFYAKCKLCLTSYKCVLRSRYVFLVLTIFLRHPV